MLILVIFDPTNLQGRVDDWTGRFSNSNKYYAFQPVWIKLVNFSSILFIYLETMSYNCF